jgi:CRP-like cAMP-binding protein
MTAENIQLLRSIGKITNFEKSHMLFMQNDPGDSMYIAVKGKFGVYINSFTDFPVRVAEISNGLCFGEMSVIDGWPRSASIVAEEDSIALEIKKENFPKFMEACPGLVFGMMKTLAGRAQSTIEKVRESGKETPDLPENFRNPQQSDAKTNMDIMIGLSHRTRELNELLGVGKQATIEMKTEATSLLALLPEGHPPLDIADKMDNSKLLGNKSFVCPYCHHVFMGKVPIFTRLEEAETTFDQRVLYTNLNMALYANAVCPNCNYSDTYQEFSKLPDYGIGPRVTQNQFENAEKFTGFANEISRTAYEAIASHYLQIVCLGVVSDNELPMAKAQQRLFWLYCDFGEEKLAKRAAADAFSSYTKYVKKVDENLSTLDLVTINVIRAELSLAFDDVEGAQIIYEENAKIGRNLKHDLVQRSIKRARELKNSW